MLNTSFLQFIIEGLLSFIVGVASIWMVHDWPDKARFLTPLEREMVFLRLKNDTGILSEGNFSWKVVRRALCDWKVSYGFNCKCDGGLTFG